MPAIYTTNLYGIPLSIDKVAIFPQITMTKQKSKSQIDYQTEDDNFVLGVLVNFSFKMSRTNLQVNELLWINCGLSTENKIIR